MDSLARKNERMSRWTYADYKKWEPGVNGRYEIINGEALAMASPTAYHQSVLVEFARQISNFLAGKPCKVYVAPYDVRLFYKEDETDNTVVQPDIAVVCDEKKRGAEGCRGAPDFIIEIISPSTRSDDFVRKFNLYMDAGVREYWLADPESKTVRVCRLQQGGYFVTNYSGNEQLPVTVLDGLIINLKAAFAN
jgi:Uma2 family endonuclease